MNVFSRTNLPMRRLAVVAVSLFFTPFAMVAHAAQLDIQLEQAVLVVPKKLTGVESNAIDLLLDEVEKRTLIRWEVTDTWSKGSKPVIAIAKADAIQKIAKPHASLLKTRKPLTQGEEGYRILSVSDSSQPALLVIGHDDRGLLFGCGRLLRELRMTKRRVGLERALDIDTVPAIPIRGHQMGYRPKTNSYDAWSIPIWEQYLRDLIVFGTNAVELIPPRSDDAADSPHFPLPPMEMMIRMSQLFDDYDTDVWVWYPAIDSDYTDSGTMDNALKEWSDVLSQLPRVDAIFVPGGDPGKSPPKVLMTILEKQMENLRRHHPKAELWVSPQGFHPEWMDEFLGLVQERKPAWLDGIVFGPQNCIGLPELRERLPKQYRIRRYPDITHNIRCQYAVSEWDVAYAMTEHRESINPRPRTMAHVFRLWKDSADGFITYSEGCNDDVNKILWSALGWDPEHDVVDILRQYSRYFIGEDYADTFAQGLLALEKNWDAPLLTNSDVMTTLQRFQALEDAATPQVLLKWRFQQALYRAYYDAYIRSRLLYETQLEASAMDTLRRADEWGTLLAIERAEAILNRAVLERPAVDWRNRVFELAEALYQSIRMQLSVPRYQAIYHERGANLDSIDRPLNNRNWLMDRFAEVREIDSEKERRRALGQIVNWTDPGPGGFYDDLGDVANQPHLIRGLGYLADPEYRQSSRVAFDYSRAFRMSWIRFAETRYGTPLRMRYEDLDPSASYSVKIVYTGEWRYHGDIRIRLEADGRQIHPPMAKPRPVKPLEFGIPQELTQDGILELSWFDNQDRTGAGRGCQVAEVWLMRNPDR